ncbi:39S ribosomal protein L9, mitochondrial [Notechis scutatus]|uniref:Large ribosomal subunit protein bL9m n=1 Tax=Notechis scutatus TaxID=8663 RepID=A0A6J1VUU3_9SAUR|nr:39S ribosomal protein L9, mitochondrial [Notechis scutatus]
MMAAALSRAVLGAPAGFLPLLLPRGLSLSAPRETVVVERWWKVPLSKKGREPRIKHPRFRVFRLVEDLKHRPKEPLELILTEPVEDVGNRGETVLVHRSFGRNHLLFRNRAVYASPENKKFFEEENRLREEGKLPRLQSHSGMKVNGLDTVRVPLSVQPFAEPKSSSQRLRLAQKEPEPAERKGRKP